MPLSPGPVPPANGYCSVLSPNARKNTIVAEDLRLTQRRRQTYGLTCNWLKLENAYLNLALESRRIVPRLSAIALLTLSLFPAAVLAQSSPRYLPLGPADAALYKPDTGPAPHVAVLVIHRTADYLRHPACTELSRRGFMVLCMNTRFTNNEMLVRFEELALDVKAGVQLLRAQPGITKVVLFGHSGGGPTTSFYQAVAENGTAFCKAPNKLVQCTEELAGLGPADGIVFADAHPGNPVNVLRGLNPSVLDESESSVPAGKCRP